MDLEQEQINLAVAGSSGTIPLDSEPNATRKYNKADWEAQRAEITRLYKSNTLENVRMFMRERYWLDAT
jgi:hypothetical protein